ncbi:MAG: flagellar motor switch protein FliG [Rhodobacterales bacterium]|nr:flagellar motor switch protein FliG [Rhodobacterales bacterium]
MTPPATRSSDARNLTRRRKAAIVVQMLLAEGVRPPIAKLPDDHQIDLTRELGSLQLVDLNTLHAVAEEFSRELEQVGLTAPSGMDAALAALSAHISPTAAARLRSEAASAAGLDPWFAITCLTSAELRPILESEAIEICAILLSKLPVSKAAEVLGLLPGDRARRITFFVSQTSAVSPQSVARIGRALAADYCNTPVPAFPHPPVDRVGAILNQSQQITRDSVLEGLGQDDPDFAEKVRRAIFTFVHIPQRLQPADVPRILRAVDQPVLVTALAAALAIEGPESQSAGFILSNISQRLAESLREEINERGKVRKQDGEAAMTAIVTAIRSSEQAKEITLIVPWGEETA